MNTSTWHVQWRNCKVNENYSWSYVTDEPLSFEDAILKEEEVWAGHPGNGMLATRIVSTSHQIKRHQTDQQKKRPRVSIETKTSISFDKKYQHLLYVFCNVCATELRIEFPTTQDEIAFLEEPFCIMCKSTKVVVGKGDRHAKKA